MADRHTPRILGACALAACIGAVTGSAAVHGATSELLESSKAFAASASLGDRAIVVRYAIADGYYLYRNKFKFRLDPPGAQAAGAALPKGEIRQDEFFGRVEIYRGTVSLRIPLQPGTAAGALTVRAISQGCADAGVCYPPREDVLVLDRRTGESVPAQAKPGSGRSLVEELSGGSPSSR
ncbi:MAG: protein-disulfide reductase DsbD N-terminal domain-containing protein [Betaproteobacteria bacterium]|nr:protein-disulfide reductase DsbD N-terminal domain-containing protein [Betaproteobacteria bacterium]